MYESNHESYAAEYDPVHTDAVHRHLCIEELPYAT